MEENQEQVQNHNGELKKEAAETFKETKDQIKNINFKSLCPPSLIPLLIIKETMTGTNNSKTTSSILKRGANIASFFVLDKYIKILFIL